MARLIKEYRDKIRPALMKEFGYSNVHQAARLVKVVVNMGVGEGVGDSKIAAVAAEQLSLIAGQHAVVTRARRAIAAFKLREGVPVGTRVTIRGARMYEFVDRLVNIALPRVRDFRGLSPKSFDGQGNYAFGLKEHIVFPEVDYDTVDKIRGLDVAIHTTAKKDEEGRALLAGFAFPFRNPT